MTVKFPTYPKYKPIHLGWLSQIPDHWEVKRLKHLGEAIIGLTYSPGEVVAETDGTLVLRASNIQNKQLAFNDNVFVSKKIPLKLITRKGDILICARNGSRTLIGKNAQIDENSTGLSFGAFMLVFRSQYNNYLSKVFNSALFEYQSSSFLTTTINQLTTGNLNNFEIPMPGEAERIKIASFLEHETAKIDKLIIKQQQLIQLLKEKRQAVISHAVTKGLNPNAKMRDSGIEWLGEVPENWDIIPLKYLCTFSGGGTPSKENLSYWTDGDIPWVSPKDMKSFWLSDTQDKITEKAVVESSTNLVDSGALLMVVRSGILQRKIPIAINSVRVTLNQDMKALRFNARMNAEYAANFIFGHEKSLLLKWSKEGATVESIEHEYLASGLFLAPPIEEQIYINKAITERMKLFQSVEDNAIRGVVLLQERRTALISAAVTGKIDVRGWAAPKNSDTNKEEAA